MSLYYLIFIGEVERLLKDYMQNQELVMNLGNRYYQVIYPIQMRRQGLDTRDRRNQGYGKVCLLSSPYLS